MSILPGARTLLQENYKNKVQSERRPLKVMQSPQPFVAQLPPSSLSAPNIKIFIQRKHHSTGSGRSRRSIFSALPMSRTPSVCLEAVSVNDVVFMRQQRRYEQLQPGGQPELRRNRKRLSMTLHPVHKTAENGQARLSFLSSAPTPATRVPRSSALLPRYPVSVRHTRAPAMFAWRKFMLREREVQ